jgi:hypothetical protein
MDALKGSCLCGGIEYEVVGPLFAMACCHCVQCRKASGAEFATNASVRSSDFRILTGAELLSEYESSPGQMRIFCGRCGSPMMKKFSEDPNKVRLRLGCLDSDLEQESLLHVFTSEMPNWSRICDDLPQFETLPKAPKD